MPPWIATLTQILAQLPSEKKFRQIGESVLEPSQS